jgi:hypothetical protein
MTKSLTLFLCGDVMLGCGIDQILPHPGDPHLRELYVGSAKQYVQLAEEVNGPIPAQVDFSYVWGDALDELQRAAPRARIINLETSVTKSRDYAPKGINYKMNPENIACLTAAGVDCCVLANKSRSRFWRSRTLRNAGCLKTVQHTKRWRRPRLGRSAGPGGHRGNKCRQDTGLRVGMRQQRDTASMGRWT